MATRRRSTRQTTARAAAGREPANATLSASRSGATAPDVAHVDVNPSRGARAYQTALRVGKPLAIGGAGLAIGGVGLAVGGKFAGAGLRDLLTGAGEGVGAGTGAALELSLGGAGEGAEQLGEGLGEGLKSLLPFLILGGIALFALKGGA